jgi:hypothetical protein
MARPDDKDIENAIRMAAETAEAKALRDHINYAVSAYAAYLNKHARGFNISVTVGSPTQGQPSISVFHPFQFGAH